jgi:hypothetical protein
MTAPKSLVAFNRRKHDFYTRITRGPRQRLPKMIRTSNIVLHLPVLEWYASLCDHVTEFGVEDGHSTTAFIAGCKGEVVSYDVVFTPVARQLQKMSLPCKWTFIKADTIDPETTIAPTDLLFIDTLHTYNQVKRELDLHGDKARRYIAFHDTYSCDTVDRSSHGSRELGIMPAITEYFGARPEFQLVYNTDACNGLQIYERKGSPPRLEPKTVTLDWQGGTEVRDRLTDAQYKDFYG